MGGNGPSRFYEEEEEESGRVSLVEGIRLSDRVINRMKHSSKVTCPHVSPKPQAPAPIPVPPPPVEHLLPLLTPHPAALEAKPSPPPSSPVTLITPPPVKFQPLPPTSVEPGEIKNPPPTASPVVETLTKSEPPSSPPVLKTEPVNEPVVLAPSVEAYPVAASSPSPVDACHLSPQLEPASPPAETPVVPSAALEEVPPIGAPAAGVEPPQAAPEPGAAPSRDPSLEETSSTCQCEVLSVVPTESLADAPPSEPVPPPPPGPVPPTEEFTMTTSLPPFLEEESPMTAASVTAGETLSVTPEVTEEELRQEIRAELQKRLDEEMDQKKQELQRQLDELKSRADAEARAAAQTRVEQQVNETLEAEKGAYLEKMTESIARERMKTDDERLLVQLYWMELKAHQLQQKEKDLKKREALYQEQVAKIEARCAEFYRASGESFKKGKEETHNRFVRFDIQPVCRDLQAQILKCYKENAGKTLICSGIASAYMQCVDNAKKNKLTPGG